jgi:hypothetical protein
VGRTNFSVLYRAPDIKSIRLFLAQLIEAFDRLIFWFGCTRGRQAMIFLKGFESRKYAPIRNACNAYFFVRLLKQERPRCRYTCGLYKDNIPNFEENVKLFESAQPY